MSAAMDGEKLRAIIAKWRLEADRILEKNSAVWASAVWAAIHNFSEELEKVLDDAASAIPPAMDGEKLAVRITECLARGGLFNMELMEAGKVRDLLIDCRTAFGATLPPSPAAGVTLTEEQVRDILHKTWAGWSNGSIEQLTKALNAASAPAVAETPAEKKLKY
jgi:hypothetical protein